MAVEKSYARLGLFLVVALMVVLVIVLFRLLQGVFVGGSIVVAVSLDRLRKH